MNSERYLQMLQDYVWPMISGWENIDDLIFMQDGENLTLQMPYVCGWMRSFRDVGWDDADLMNGPQEVQISIL
jgi:hypothetical protein